jgi:hypothetical protein
MNMNTDRIAEMKARLHAAWNAATDDQIARGRAWYPVAHDLAEMIGNGNVRIGAGIIAALSPRMQWDRNVKLAVDAGNGNVHGAMGASLVKVQRILDGSDPADVLPNGAKTWHFFHNIVDPSDSAYVTIDAWAYRAATGDWSAVGPKSTRDYAEVAAAYIGFAGDIGELANVGQAGVWNWARETKH